MARLGFKRHRHSHRPWPLVVGDAVVDQGVQNLAQAGGVGLHAPIRRCIAGPVELHADIGRLGANLITHLSHCGANGHRLGVQAQGTGLNPRDVQHVVDHVQQMPARLLNLMQALVLSGRQGGLLVDVHDLRKPEHRIEWRAQLMAHA